MSLNQAQRRAVSHGDGPCIVLAGPGSGKTLTIAKRIEYLMQRHHVKPEEILVITFTRYASREMRERFEQLMGGKKYPVTFGTFHGIYYGILKWAYKLGAENLLSEEERYQLLAEAAWQVGVTEDRNADRELLQDLSSEIGYVKNAMVSLHTYESIHMDSGLFRKVYREYERLRKSRKKMDFDDMLVLCYELFLNRPDLLALWQKKFRYILVDEFQDINRIQYEILKMLAHPENNLFIVGDDDQSIYRFRGAMPDIMLGFQKEFPQAKAYVLDQNYRSTQTIVEESQKVIAHNRKRCEKQLSATRGYGKPIHVQEMRHASEESTYVAEKIRETVKSGGNWSDIAVLYRSSMDARVLMETLMEYHIPFYTREYAQSVYDHFIGRDLLAYIRMVRGGRSRKDFLAVMNRPNRYIGRNSVERAEISFEDLRNFYCDKEWMQDRIDQFELDLRMMEHMTPYAAIQYIRKRIGYDDFLKEYAETRKIPVEELFEVLAVIEEKSKTYKTYEAWFQHIQEYREKLQQKAGENRQDRDAVSLMTIHSAKGLEFEHVFIIEANEGVLPYKKAEQEEEIEEERRLFYVAMTRAKSELTVSYVRERNGRRTRPSRFVEELLAQKKDCGTGK